MPTLGQKIREVRLQRGMTQADLGANLVTPSMISQIESDRAKPSFALLSELANRLGVPVDYFLTPSEEEFPLPVQLKIADLLERSGRMQEAFQLLQRLEPGSPGLVRQEYELLLARAYRGLRDYQACIPLLEGLREQALRAGDPRLLFYTCAECGHVEYAMDNLPGAIHEWEKAFELGEVLCRSAAYAPIEIRAAWMDVALCLHRAYLRAGDKAAAQAVIEQVQPWTHPLRDVRQLALGLWEEAQHTLRTGEPSRARTLVEQAAAVLEAGTWLQLYILFTAVAGSAGSGAHASSLAPTQPVHSSEEAAATQIADHSGQGADANDPAGEMEESMGQPAWDVERSAARSAIAADVHRFLEAELHAIESLLASGQHEVALRRLDRCASILADYAQEAADDERLQRSERRLHRARALALQASGQLAEAAAVWESLADTARSGEWSWKAECMARLVELYAATGQAELALQRSEELFALAGKMAEFPLGFILR
ncbi:hypothetical protein GCM10010885_23920 [Alicyclobacillus cellulosilyticus]|uniref:HTH cro/C1-type domain-containing protein n=1 Tax=Alicyclobacillus cellulosilyticus TaxID=1003997 RepID=A0A917KH37_9BACL|nr:helix-turn-helix transcriptional regulator [Alicyclobacillus cellulosilyticus]GGJ13780.1 hypothetical protein GCM10010885_23920 [Alicyclobacillus cellulosilyticus]